MTESIKVGKIEVRREDPTQYPTIYIDGKYWEVTTDWPKVVSALMDHIAKQAEFKKYVHGRLDKMEVPCNPDPVLNREHGCRIEGRLNWIQDNWKYRLERLDK